MAVWLDAWLDPVSSIHTVPSCIRLVDVTGDGDPKLLVADQNRKLRMYKGEPAQPSYPLFPQL
jgi:Bardet-Biedl syndrome 1 protein